MSSTPLSYTAWHIWQSVWFHSHHWFSPCHSFALSPDSTLNFPYSKLEYRVGILNLKFFLKQQSIDDNCCCFVESRIWVLVTPWTAAHQTSLSFIIFQSLLKLMSIESVMPSNHLILCLPLLLSSICPSIRVFSNELAFHISWPKYWSFSFSIHPSNDYSGFVSFTIHYLLAVQGTLKVFSSTTVQKHQSLGTQPSLWFSYHICTWLLEKP